jgi:hypothetical protein
VLLEELAQADLLTEKLFIKGAQAKELFVFELLSFFSNGLYWSRV